jgi:hypothetical protein
MLREIDKRSKSGFTYICTMYILSADLLSSGLEWLTRMKWLIQYGRMDSETVFFPARHTISMIHSNYMYLLGTTYSIILTTRNHGEIGMDSSDSTMVLWWFLLITCTYLHRAVCSVGSRSILSRHIYMRAAFQGCPWIRRGRWNPTSEVPGQHIWCLWDTCISRHVSPNDLGRKCSVPARGFSPEIFS